MSETISEKRIELSRSTLPFSRRQILIGTSGAILATVRPTGVRAADHTHTATSTSSGKHRDLVDAAVSCVGLGEICLKHIMDQSAARDSSLAVCGVRVNEMTAVCRALVTLAASDSPHLKSFAKVCIDVCRSCETECRKHEQHHAICKETADACARVVAACEKLVA